MNVLLLWHMHQPYYVNPLTKTAMMPWVRLHAVKGYLDMIDVIERAPQVKMTFNFAPVLVRQIEELVQGDVTDLWETWSRKSADTLTDDEKRRLLENFFKINWETQIKPYPRYAELLQRRGMQWNNESLSAAMELYAAGDYRDLQVWYNLAWCGFSAVKRYPLLAELKAQGRNFTEAQKNALLDIHQEILALILPLYRAAAERGQIELTTTPYFHPIMPLVYDTNIARRSMPNATLPARFAAPEDVAAQLWLAQEQHARVFGRPARGLWPSEGSMSPEMVPLLRQAGFDYFCTDEGNLFRSLEQDPHWRGRSVDHLELFQGWRVTHEGNQVNALFRERPLSNFIGFNAAKGDAESSAQYVVHHLEHIATVRPEPHHAVLLALDGENAWEAFPDGAEKFLTLLYQKLSRSAAIETRTLAEYFDAFPPQVEISRLHSGSWINTDFDIWIGDAEENKAWEWLAKTRRFLVERIAANQVSREAADAAWWSIYAAEGSDWFWWYGPDFATDSDFLFDDLFRTHLQNVYRHLGERPPAMFEIPICAHASEVPYTRPRLLLKPPVSGRLEKFFDWVGAGVLDLERQHTAMFQSDRIGEKLYYGFNQHAFYLRLDLRRKPEGIVLRCFEPYEIKITLFERDGIWRAQEAVVDDGIQAAWGDFFVLMVPRDLIGWDFTRTSATISFAVDILENGRVRERYPERGAIEFPIPAPDFGAGQWFI